uniref:Putative secreted protein n=1 Tax=Anopheles darlingi TaxID=43151 RepID=A0A2M4DRZ6_ANODA
MFLVPSGRCPRALWGVLIWESPEITLSAGPGMYLSGSAYGSGMSRSWPEDFWWKSRFCSPFRACFSSLVSSCLTPFIASYTNDG